jgi:hypothetical protein
MSIGAQKIHRRNRRKLGRGQVPPLPVAVPTISTSGTTNLTMNWNVPVVVRGNIGTAVATRTLVSQTIVSPTQVTQVWSGNVTGLAFSLPANDPNVSSSIGGATAGTAGVFP